MASSIVGKGADRAPEPFVVAGPLCESGDVFTRDDKELLDPRALPRPELGNLLVLHDAGAYGASMSSNYVSIGRVPQIYWDDRPRHLGVAPRDDRRRRHARRVRRTDLTPRSRTRSREGEPAPARASWRERGRGTARDLLRVPN